MHTPCNYRKKEGDGSEKIDKITIVLELTAELEINAISIRNFH